MGVIFLVMYGKVRRFKYDGITGKGNLGNYAKCLSDKLCSMARAEIINDTAPPCH